MKKKRLTYNEAYIQFFYNEAIPKIIIDSGSLKIIDANKAAIDFYGYGEDILSMKISDINTLPEKQLFKIIKKASAGPQVYYFKHRTAGGIRDIESHTNHIIIDNKILIQTAIIDITERNKNYEELYASAKKYQQLFKNMSDALAYCQKIKLESTINKSKYGYEILEVNDAFKRLFSSSRNNFKSFKSINNITDFLPELNESILELLNSYSFAPDTLHITRYFTQIDKWLRINFFMQADFFVIMINDTTKDKIFEKALSESHRFLKSIFNTLHISIAVLDENGMIIQLNDSWKRQKVSCGLLGPECRAGMNYVEICNQTIADNPDNFILLSAAETISQSINDALYNKNLNRAREININDRYFMVTTSVFEWPESCRIILAFEDITEQKKAKEKIENLSFAVEQSPTAVIVTDSEGVIEYVNQKFSLLTGYSFEDAVGNNPRILKSGYHDADYYKNIWQLLKAGKEWRGEFRNKRKNGTLYWESALIAPIISETGKIARLIAIKEDISVRKNIEELLKKSKEEAVIARKAAEEANNAKSRFLANMSHEIRTPMNSIIGFTDILASSRLSYEQKELLDYIKTSSNALLSLINDILDLSKIEAGKLEIEYHEFDINLILDQVLNITRTSVSKKSIKFSCVLDPAINFKIISDSLRLRQVLLNLVDNAIKFTAPSKHVRISIALESFNDNEAQIKFTVTDEGTGIPENKIKTIFMSFMQSDSSITRKFGGTGLGLTISDQIIKLMGGDGINVNSKEGVGSVFYFTLKLKKGGSVHYNKPSPAADKLIEPLKNINYNILLVEDNQSNIVLTTKVLSKFGHKIEVALNGEEAIKMNEAHNYDLILMDIQMPVMDGLEATKLIRLKGYHIPIIAMTASAMKGDYEACIAAGMDGYISKPINISEINKIIRSVFLRSTEENNKNINSHVQLTASNNTYKHKPAAEKNEIIKQQILPAEENNTIKNISADKKIDAIQHQLKLTTISNDNENKIFDAEKLLFNMGNIKELAIDSVNMFLEYSVPYYEEVKKAIETKNFDQIKRAAHKFKGTSLNACAMKIAALLLSIEGAAKLCNMDECTSLFLGLEKEIEIFKIKVNESNFFN